VKSFRQKIAAVLLGLLLACCPFAFALNPSLDVNQYAHMAWKVREGFSKGAINAITQTPDGYIWLGTDFGMLRFDGVKRVEWNPPQDHHLPSNTIYSLLAARDGTLWIGTTKGLASWKDGRLSGYPEIAGQIIYSLIEDREGTIWVGSVGLPPPGRLCAIQSGKVRCSGEEGSLGDGVKKLYQDSKGNLWAGTNTGVWRWKPGNAQYYPLAAKADGYLGLAEDSDGAILIATRKGVSRIVNGKVEAYPLPTTTPRFDIRRLLRDRDGGLWIGTVDRGVLHVHAGRTNIFAMADGLSGNRVNELFEDREGNIWVTTMNGLDRFHGFAVTTFTVKQGLSNATVQSVMADSSGGIWLSTFGGLDRWANGSIATYDKGSVKLHGLLPESLFQDHSGRIWVSTQRSFGYFENARFVSLSAVPGGPVSIAEDSAGNLWIANQDQGLTRLRKGRVAQHIPWAGIGRKDFATALAVDGNGGLWLGFFNSGLAYLADGGVRSSYTTGDGLGNGHVSNLRIGRDGALWVATEGGLSRLKNGRIATLTSEQGLPCNTVHWTIEDDDHSTWLYMPCGLVRIAQSEMDGWAAAADQGNTGHTIKVMVFDSSDGVRTVPTVGMGSQVAKSPDGKLWFLPWDGVSVIDPHHIPVNKLAPLVHVEQITADGNTYNPSRGLRLPPLVRNLEIDYTALSLVAPEKIRFRYKLEGQDPQWREAVNNREVQYSNLPPAHYTFRVMACNNSGVWNQDGATLDFSIAPAYYQATWFRALCVAVGIAFLWLLYQLRRRQLQQQFNMRLETRVNERTRIARELHDTLLQSFHGLMFRFQAARNMLPRRPEEAMQALDGAITRAEQAIAEGRSAIQDLRPAPGAQTDLVQALTSIGQEFATHDGNQDPPRFRVIVEGERRKLSRVFQGKFTEWAANSCRMLSIMPMRVRSKPRFATIIECSTCSYAMMEKVLIRKFWSKADAPGTGDCWESVNVRSKSARNWIFGVKPAPAPKSG
jgi:ligand-binding sensor domain-containing protein